MSEITPAAIYRAIFAGKTISVACPPDKYQSLRVAIQRQHQTPRALDLTDDVLKASYNAGKGIATFKLGPKRASSSFTIVEIQDDPQVRDDLVEDSGQPRSGSLDHSDSDKQRDDSDCHQHGAAGEIQSEHDAQVAELAKLWASGNKA